VSAHTPTRCRKVRRVSESHRQTLRQIVSASSIDAVSRRLRVGRETLEAALALGTTFRLHTAERIEKSVEEARGE
jgi:hypothetical protein